MGSISVEETTTTMATATNVDRVDNNDDGEYLLSPPDVSLVSDEAADNTTPVASIVVEEGGERDEAEAAPAGGAIPFEAVTKMSITSSSSGSDRGMCAMRIPC